MAKDADDRVARNNTFIADAAELAGNAIIPPNDFNEWLPAGGALTDGAVGQKPIAPFVFLEATVEAILVLGVIALGYAWLIVKYLESRDE